MSASETPRTDAVALDEREGITHPELYETYMAWTDYWALRELARQLERELAAANERYKYLYGLHAQEQERNAAMIDALATERDALRADVDRLFAASNELAAENTALRADAERLDWMGRNPRLSTIYVDGRAKDCYFYGVAGAPGLKLREIIDAAIDLERAK